MANQVDEMPEKDAASWAASVCAAVLSGGKHDGGFAMSINELRQVMDLSEHQAKVATMWAAEREWVRLRANAGGTGGSRHLCGEGNSPAPSIRAPTALLEERKVFGGTRRNRLR